MDLAQTSKKHDFRKDRISSILIVNQKEQRTHQNTNQQMERDHRDEDQQRKSEVIIIGFFSGLIQIWSNVTQDDNTQTISLENEIFTNIEVVKLCAQQISTSTAHKNFCLFVGHEISKAQQKQSQSTTHSLLSLYLINSSLASTPLSFPLIQGGRISALSTSRLGKKVIVCGSVGSEVFVVSIGDEFLKEKPDSQNSNIFSPSNSNELISHPTPQAVYYTIDEQVEDVHVAGVVTVLTGARLGRIILKGEGRVYLDEVYSLLILGIGTI